MALRMLLEHCSHHGEFTAARLAPLKRANGTTVSVALPARDEAATVGAIVARIRRQLVEDTGLVDEIVVLDDGSSDDTAETAAAAGAEVVHASDVLPGVGPDEAGKGGALWRSLAVTDGDLVCWLDADLRDFSPHFVTGLLGPLLTKPSIGFVKAFYERPVDDDGQGGGRVTELVARPLISKLFPHLATIVQPLGGEYAGRRALLEQVPFVGGWGVELGLLVDLVQRFGSRAIAQVDLGVRRHRNRPLDELAPQAMEILGTALRKAGAEDERWGRELLRVTGDRRLERVPAAVHEYPPLATVPEYRRLRGLDEPGEQSA